MIGSISSLKRVISFVAFKSPAGGTAVINLTLGQSVCVLRGQQGSHTGARMLLTSWDVFLSDKGGSLVPGEQDGHSEHAAPPSQLDCSHRFTIG